MQFPKLTPLQSRFAVSLTASVALIVIYYFLWTPKFAYAAELDLGRQAASQSIAGYDIDLIYDDLDVEEELDQEEHTLRQRATDIVSLSQNNVPGTLNLEPGKSQVWLYPNTTLYGNHTDKGVGLPSSIGTNISDGAANAAQNTTGTSKAPRTVYISINTCLQPTWNASIPQSDAPPQLTLYVSTDTSNTNPGPNVTNGTQVALPLTEGFANFSMNATESIYMTVTAPELPENYTGVWNYALAASIDGYYHTYNPAPFLYLIDTDTYAGLLVTDNLTLANSSSDVFQKWMNLTAPFIVFAQDAGNMAIAGVRHSFCGLQTTPAQIMADQDDSQGTTSSVQMNMITRGLGNKPKEQFYIDNLNGSSAYYAILAMQGNSTAAGPGVVGGGGQVWQPVNFQTKSGKTLIGISTETRPSH